MIVLTVIGILLLLILLLGLVRVRLLIDLGEKTRVSVRIGPLGLTLFPRRKKRKKQEPEEQKEEQPSEEKPKKRRSLPHLDLEDILDLLSTALTALSKTARRACARLCIDPLELTAVFGGEDPADAARLYGMADTAMYTLMPGLERLFDIPDPSLHLRLNVNGEPTTLRGRIGFALRVGDLAAIGLTLALPLLKWYLRYRKGQKALRRKTAQKMNKSENTEDKIA